MSALADPRTLTAVVFMIAAGVALLLAVGIAGLLVAPSATQTDGDTRPVTRAEIRTFTEQLPDYTLFVTARGQVRVVPRRARAAQGGALICAQGTRYVVRRLSQAVRLDETVVPDVAVAIGGQYGAGARAAEPDG